MIFFSAKDFFGQKIFRHPKMIFVRPKNISSIKNDFFGENFFAKKIIFSPNNDFFSAKNLILPSSLFHENSVK